MSEFQSKLITLNDVIDQQFFFNIPIYQRLYVWGKEQIHTLLDDIVAALAAAAASRLAHSDRS